MEKHERHIDELFMQRAFQLAGLGRGNVSPNPLVGCVIVNDGKVIGEGWHMKYGGAHAEVNAVASVQDKSMLSTSTVYVNLEPCSHFGKTPPCADLLIQYGVRRVVIANMDSNPLVGGKGIARLRDAGVDVVQGVFEKEGRHLNCRFFTMFEKQRPYIILKWAQTSDSFIARANYDSKWISDETSRRLVHRWRAEEDAVLVGSATAQYDDPKLNVRDWSGRDPVRVVIDRSLKLREDLHLFDGSQATIRYNLMIEEERPNLLLVQLSGTNLVEELLSDLHRRNIQSVIVEGGADTLTRFLGAGFWDEARIFTSPQIFGSGIPAPIITGYPSTSVRLAADELTTITKAG